MGPVQVTVLVHHLQFHPETKLQPQLLHLTGKTGDAVRQLFKVDVPVAKTSVVIIPGPEPSVIKNEQLHTGLFCFLCYG
jgi:hypothetical protein